MPIAAKYVNVAEWGQLPAHGLQHFSGDKLWLFVENLGRVKDPGA